MRTIEEFIANRGNLDVDGAKIRMRDHYGLAKDARLSDFDAFRWMRAMAKRWRKLAHRRDVRAGGGYGGRVS